MTDSNDFDFDSLLAQDLSKDDLPQTDSLFKNLARLADNKSQDFIAEDNIEEVVVDTLPIKAETIKSVIVKQVETIKPVIEKKVIIKKNELGISVTKFRTH